MKKQEQLLSLQDCIVTEVLIQCGKCERVKDSWDNTGDFAEDLYSQGWRYKDGESVCPECLKQKKL